MKEVMTISEVAILLNVSNQTVRRNILAGHLKAIKKANKIGYKITKDDLTSFVEKHSKYKIKNVSEEVDDDFIDKVYNSFVNEIKHAFTTSEFEGQTVESITSIKDFFSNFIEKITKENNDCYNIYEIKSYLIMCDYLIAKINSQK